MGRGLPGCPRLHWKETWTSPPLDCRERLHFPPAPHTRVNSPTTAATILLWPDIVDGGVVSLTVTVSGIVSLSVTMTVTVSVTVGAALIPGIVWEEGCHGGRWWILS